MNGPIGLMVNGLSERYETIIGFKIVKDPLG
jgi:hypothetical protein